LVYLQENIDLVHTLKSKRGSECKSQINIHLPTVVNFQPPLFSSTGSSVVPIQRNQTLPAHSAGCLGIWSRISV